MIRPNKKTKTARAAAKSKNAPEKKFRMIQRAEAAGKTIQMMGTAHFFPYSFRADITRLLQSARRIIFEGPLDAGSMQQVAAAGRASGAEPHLFDRLRPDAVDRLARVLMPSCLNRLPSFFANIRCFKAADPLYELVSGMKPWLAFFTLWGTFLQNRGWRCSVDMEAYGLACEMEKPVVFLETIEEQVRVLESIPVEKLVGFLEQADQWPAYAEQYVCHYLEGDLKALLSITTGFPSRRWDVIDRRDRILFERMMANLHEETTVVCVGAPHLGGMGLLMEKSGFRVHRPPGCLPGAAG